MSNKAENRKFKLRHENMWAKIAIVLAVLFFMVTLIMQATLLMIVSLVILFLTVLWFVLDLIVGASIVVSEEEVAINRLFSSKKIRITDIGTVETEEYTRTRNHHTEYRLKMTMFYGSGEKIVLSDNASTTGGLAGFISGERDRRPYVDIPLYQAYMLIKEKKDQFKAG